MPLTDEYKRLDALLLRPATQCFEYPLGHDWTKLESPPGFGIAWIDLDRRIICTPWGDSYYARFARWHELTHMKITRENPIVLAKRAKCSPDIIQKVEDARVHHYLAEQVGFDLSGGCAPPEMVEAFVTGVLESNDQRMLTLMLIATSFTGSRPLMDALLERQHPKKGRELQKTRSLADAAIARLFGKSSRPSLDDMVDAAAWLAREFRKQHPPRRFSSSKKSAAPGSRKSVDPEDLNATDNHTNPIGSPGSGDPISETSWGPPLSQATLSEQEPCRDILDLIKDFGIEAFLSQHLRDLERKRGPVKIPSGTGEGLWGPMEIQQPPLAKPVRGSWRSRWRASSEGVDMRYIYRLPIDGKPFGTKRSDQCGTVLIDASGSMRWSPGDVKTIADHAPGATIAMYCGDRERGVLRILARAGRTVSDEAFVNDIGGNNLIDGPALRWLSTQPRPRLWVSDGQVTGKSSMAEVPLRQDARKICGEAGIRRLPHIAEAIAYFRDQGRRSSLGLHGFDAMAVHDNTFE